MAREWGKIVVGTRLEKQVDADFLVTWTSLVTRGLRPGDGHVIVQGLVAHRAANAIVRSALKTDADTLFFLDSDAAIGTAFLEEFRNYEPGWEYDCLQAFYTRRGFPPEAIWYKRGADGGLYQYYVFEDDFTTDVSVIGLHTALIRLDVFRKILGDHDPETFDWFYYPRHIKMSEDVAFSEEAEQAGFRLGATTHVKAGHLSQVTTGWETYQEFLVLSGQKERVFRYQRLLGEIAEFTGETKDVVEMKARHGSQNVREAWQQKEPHGADQVRAFYGERDNGYLYDLLAWNVTPFYDQITAPLKAYRHRRALVVGTGLGLEAEMLTPQNRVWAFDLPGVLKDFAQGHITGRVKWLKGATLAAAIGSRHFDLVVMIDVIEHLHPDEFETAMDAVARALGPGGELYAHVNFEQQDLYPMHYDLHERFEAWCAANGMTQVGTYVWRKA